MSKNKLKTYRIYWESEVAGYLDVEAFDEEDANDQAPLRLCSDELDDFVLYPKVTSIELVKMTTKKARHRAPKSTTSTKKRKKK